MALKQRRSLQKPVWMNLTPSFSRIVTGLFFLCVPLIQWKGRIFRVSCHAPLSPIHCWDASNHQAKYSLHWVSSWNICFCLTVQIRLPIRIWLDVFSHYTGYPDPRVKLLVCLEFHVIQTNYECMYLEICSTRTQITSDTVRLRSISPLSNLSETFGNGWPLMFFRREYWISVVVEG